MFSVILYKRYIEKAFIKDYFLMKVEGFSLKPILTVRGKRCHIGYGQSSSLLPG